MEVVFVFFKSMFCSVFSKCSKSLFLVVLLALSSFSFAQANNKYAAMIIHEGSGDVLFSRNANKSLHPASLTKIMTLYLLFEEIENGRKDMDGLLSTSRRAASQPPSKLGLRKGEYITVSTAVNALIIKSANDVSVVVAENIAGSEYKFVKMMNEKAKSLGMTRTTFKNPHGLSHKYMRSTANDLAILSQRLVQDFPQYYHLFSQKSFKYKGKEIFSHNHLLKKFSGSEGLKTGYTRLAGYNLVTTATRNGERLIGVVLGGKSSKSRDSHMKSILTKAFYSKKIKKKDLNIAYLKPQLPVIKSINHSKKNDQLEKYQIASNYSQKSLDSDVDQNPISRMIDEVESQGNDVSETTIVSASNDINNSIEKLISENQKIEVGEGDYETDKEKETKKDDFYVQIGAFSNIIKANKELSKAIQITKSNRSYINSSFSDSKNKNLYRPRILVASFSQGTKTCKTLTEYKISCFVNQNK